MSIPDISPVPLSSERKALSFLRGGPGCCPMDNKDVPLSRVLFC